MIPKFRAWCKINNTMIKPMTIQKMIHQKCSTIPLKSLYRDFTFMQSTGLKDKTGKEIYEGDILRYGSIEISMMGEVMIKQGEVRLYSGVLCWSLDALIRDGGVKNTLVIGNIYETPELRRNLNDSKEM